MAPAAQAGMSPRIGSGPNDGGARLARAALLPRVGEVEDNVEAAETAFEAAAEAGAMTSAQVPACGEGEGALETALVEATPSTIMVATAEVSTPPGRAAAATDTTPGREASIERRAVKGGLVSPPPPGGARLTTPMTVAATPTNGDGSRRRRHRLTLSVTEPCLSYASPPGAATGGALAAGSAEGVSETSAAMDARELREAARTRERRTFEAAEPKYTWPTPQSVFTPPQPIFTPQLFPTPPRPTAHSQPQQPPPC